MITNNLLIEKVYLTSTYFNKGQDWAGLFKSRGLSGGWAIAHKDFGRLKGFSRNELDFIMAKIVNYDTYVLNH